MKDVSIFRAFAILGGGTFLSRILGFGRDFLMAVAIGPGLITDAFIVALRFPNLFRRLFAEGAFNGAFVPLFSKKLQERGVSEAMRFGNHALAWMAMAMLLFCGLMILCMPYVVPLLVPGFVAEEDKFLLTVHLSRITFPYLFCMVASAILSGMLNAYGRFSATALAPVVLNILLIIVLLGVYSGYGWSILGGSAAALAWGVLVAGAVQLIWLFLNCRAAGLSYVFMLPRWDGDMALLFRRMLPSMMSAAVIQINLLVGDILASLLGGSAISWLFFADRLVQLPLGIIGVSLAVAVLPRLSVAVAEGDRAAVGDYLRQALRLGLFLTLPAMAALIFLSEELMLGLFGYGRFGSEDIFAVSYALRMAAIGLAGFVVVKIFLSVFFAYGDTRTPAYVSLGVVILNIILAIILMRFMGHGGIALAGSISGCVNMLVLGLLLLRLGWLRLDMDFFRFLFRVFILVLLLLFGLWFMGLLLGDLWVYEGLARFLMLLLWVIPVGLAYLVLGWLWGIFSSVQSP